MNPLKEQLWNQCKLVVQDRLANAQQAMDAAQQSANQEEKSSAGDKYETGRAMAQLERDKAASQLAENKKMLATLDQIKRASPSQRITLGSLVITDNAKFYVSISAGKLEVEGENYLAISTQSPIGQLLLHKTIGDSIVYNSQKQIILSVA